MIPDLDWIVGFGVALALLVAGHLMRVVRWEMLLRPSGQPEISTGFLALSLAYVANTFLPLRLGELLRAFYYASRTQTDVAHVLATIVVERAFDLVFVWGIVLAFAAAGVFGGVPFWSWTFISVGVAGLAFLLTWFVLRSARVRRAVWLLTSVFNPQIRLVLLDVAWSTVEVCREALARWPLLLTQSVAMWGLYLFSYWLLSVTVGFSFQHLFAILHGMPLSPAVVTFLTHDAVNLPWLLGYTAAPFALVVAYSIAANRFGVSFRGAIAWVMSPHLYVNRVSRSRDRFAEQEQYGGFLIRRFSGTTDLTADFEANGIDDIIIQRMLRGGSDAVTAIVQHGDELRVRKYAVDAAAAKLEAQCDWLRRHANTLPLVSILDQSRTASRFFYDMEYSRSSRDLFDVIHTSDVGTSWALISDVLGSIGELHERTHAGTAGIACIERYAAAKVAVNLTSIRSAFPMFFERSSVEINGRRVDLGRVRQVAEVGFWPGRLQRRSVATIHGDLTIENIMADPARPAGWFLIDPNLGNVFESPLLDYAKLMQSLHLGYESLNRDLSCSFGTGMLTFPIARTAQYAALHDRATQWLRTHLGEDGLREVRLHEIVHYFRLTPYKLRRGTHLGLAFLGCLCLLVERYFDEFERC